MPSSDGMAVGSVEIVETCVEDEDHVLVVVPHASVFVSVGPGVLVSISEDIRVDVICTRVLEFIH
jgi:hypothetical protein